MDRQVNSMFPKDAPQFFSEKGRHIKNGMDDFYIRCNTQNLDFMSEADLDNRFNAGDQSAYFELHPEIPVNLRKQFSFNRIRRITNMISGFQRRNRKSIVVVPVENGDQKTADQYSKIISHINRKEQVLSTVSSSFHEAIVTGLSLLSVWVDYRHDPVSGSIKVDNTAYNSFLIDPFFKRLDLTDCNNLWKRSYLSLNQAISLLPDRKTEIKSISGHYSDDKFNFMPENLNVDKGKLLAYDEYYYLDSRKSVVLSDSVTGETMEWDNETEVGDQELAQFLKLYPTMVMSEQMVPTVKLAILINGTLMYDGANPLGIDRYPFVPVVGYFTPSLSTMSQRIQSVVRGLRDAQWLYNRRKATEDDILSSQVNSGWLYKEDALVNPDDAFLSGQGKGIAIKSTSMIADVQKIQPAQLPPSMFQLSEFYAREIMEISGANEELLGSATDDKAGVLSMLRQGAGLTTLQPLFDCLDDSLGILGSIMLKGIQSNYAPGKVKRIVEEEPAPQFYNKAFGKYDAAIEEGVNTTTQKQAEFAQLLHLKEIGLPIPDSVIIESATIQNKTKLIEAIEQEQQQAAQKQAEMDQKAQELQTAQTNLANAKVESDLSLAKERDSRVFSNIGLMEERKLEGEKDKTQSLLNLVKTMQEIDDVDLGQLAKLIQMSKLVEVTKGPNETVAIGGAIVKGATKDVPNVPKAEASNMQSNSTQGV